MNLRTALFAIAIACASPAFAQDETPAAASPLLPESLSLSVVEGSSVPDDCMYPDTITDAAMFETSCVTMPRFGSNGIVMEYLGQLGQAGWHQGEYISGGMTAVHTDENNCLRVLNLFPSVYPPSNQNSQTVVLWFAMDRTPRCPTSEPQ